MALDNRSLIQLDEQGNVTIWDGDGNQLEAREVVTLVALPPHEGRKRTVLDVDGTLLDLTIERIESDDARPRFRVEAYVA